MFGPLWISGRLDINAQKISSPGFQSSVWVDHRRRRCRVRAVCGQKRALRPGSIFLEIGGLEHL